MTPHERKCLDYIRAYIGEHGFSPAYREIGDALGLRSKSGVYRLILSLERQNILRRERLGQHGISLKGGSPEDVLAALIKNHGQDLHDGTTLFAGAGQQLLATIRAAMA